MKKFYFIVLVFILALAPLEKVHAKGGGGGWLLGLDLSYIGNKTESTAGGVTTNGSDYSTTLYDLNFGLAMSSGLYVGGLYSSKSYSDNNTPSSNSTGTAMGASVGYMFGQGFHLTGTYLLSATDGDNKKGSGMQVDFGWKTFISSGFYVGAKLSYRTLKYTEVAGVDSVSQTTTLPYISFGFSF